MEINSFIPIDGELQPKQIMTTVLDSNGHASVQIDLKQKFSYFFLSRDLYTRDNTHRPLIDNYLIEAGDDIAIRVKYDSIYSSRVADDPGYVRPKLPSYNISFSGKGADKFECYQSWQTASIQVPVKLPYIPVLNKDGTFNTDNSDCVVLRTRIVKTLKLLKISQNSEAYSICKADMIGFALLNEGRTYNLDPQFHQIVLHNDAALDKVKTGLRFRNLISMINVGAPLSEEAVGFSKWYSKGIYEIELADFMMTHKGEFNMFYSLLKKNYFAKLRDNLLYTALSSSLLSEYSDSILRDGILSVENLTYKDKIRNLYARNKGSDAYEFSLPDVTGRLVSLSSLRGKVVLIDFYFLGCHACSGFYTKTLRKIEEYYTSNKNVVFVTISIDANEATWKKSLASEAYTSIDLNNVINLYTAGMGSNHPMVKYYGIQGYPCPILIDKRGRIIEFNYHANKDQFIENITSAIQEVNKSITSN